MSQPRSRTVVTPISKPALGWFLALTIASIPVALGARTTGKPVDEDLPRDRIVSIDFISRSRGWAVTASDEGKVSVLSTRDGGRHFRRVAAPPIDVGWTEQAHEKSKAGIPSASGIRFTDARHGWLFGPDLFETWDGGRRWTRRYRRISSIVIASGAIWGIESRGDESVVIRSWDHGRTWVDAKGQPPMRDGPRLVAVDQDRGWISEEFPAGKLLLFRTTDGGERWTELAVPEVKPDTSELAVAPDGSLWLMVADEPSAGSQDKRVYTSHDGGSTWTLRAHDQLGSGYLSGGTVALSRTDAVIALGRSAVLRTRDGGRHWKAVIDADADSFGSICFVGSRAGWVVADLLSLFRTLDGGETWQKVWIAPASRPAPPSSP
jgi:photosystem II stability/assembly factor-like uncharacterized protein